jgi:ribosomal protein S14
MQHLDFNKKVRVLNLIRIEKLKRVLFIKWYFKKLLLRSVFANSKLKKKHRMYVIFKLSLFPRYSNITQHKTRCFKTGRTHMPFRFALLARMHIRLYTKLGLLPHVGNAVF